MIIGYGILVFLIGFFLGVHFVKPLQWLMPIGSLMTFTGTFYFFKDTDIAEQLKRPSGQHLLTYFWNVIVLKLWTFIFILWMIVMNLTLILDGLQ